MFQVISRHTFVTLVRLLTSLAIGDAATLTNLSIPKISRLTFIAQCTWLACLAVWATRWATSFFNKISLETGSAYDSILRACETIRMWVLTHDTISSIVIEATHATAFTLITRLRIEVVDGITVDACVWIWTVQTARNCGACLHFGICSKRYVKQECEEEDSLHLIFLIY